MSSMSATFPRRWSFSIGGLTASIVFHVTLVVVAIGWITTKDEQYAVLPPAMTMQVGLYQLAKAETKEVPVGPEQVMSVPEAAEPEPMKEQLDVPKMPVVEQGTYERVAEKPKVKPVVKPKPVVVKVPDDLPVSEAPADTTTAPLSGENATSSADFTSTASSSRSGQMGWESLVHSHIDMYKRYPRAALRFKATGVTQVEISLNAKGELLDVSIQTSSGNRILDKEAINTIKRASPFPAPESHRLVNGSFSFIAPLSFDYRQSS
ncbi:energy transducer TonB [Proteus mirabilis]|uniref:energy transducer TonB n=1 Tax=Proteus mirabilis TaxID=584 RepID=UPI00073CABA1|nr:energy transducer TonB [Proteus mirabilis]EMA1120904.1 energy transducer TonB [Proteus mirabilis]KSW14716.1 energy transducer TonB [Proteus mirabilis]MBI6274655.1 energy transducer TonB [Proteus mirabilis]MBI6377418.1 energy transducer TonB [Proteus mirabilis]MBI6503940.1 energy transducer TonB [Proteus mirabilis]